MIEHLYLGAEVWNLKISVHGFADDFLRISDSPTKLQKHIDICYRWSIKNLMRFIISNCKVMTLNTMKTCDPFSLAGKPIDFVNTTILE